MRPIPATQSLSLFRVEESEEEALARTALKLELADGFEPAVQNLEAPQDQDAVMQDNFSLAKEPVQKRAPFKPFFTAPQATVAAQPSDVATPPAPVTQSASFAPTPVPAPWTAPAPQETAQEPFKMTQKTDTSATADTSHQPPRDDQDDDEDEEMPTIDMASDSENEDEEDV